MMALINMVGATVFAELVLFAKQAVRAEDSEVGLLFAAGGAGVVVLSLAAGPLRRRWAFGNVALGPPMLDGLLTVALAYTSSPWPGLGNWGLREGFRGPLQLNTAILRTV